MITLFAIVSLTVTPAAFGHPFSSPQTAGCDSGLAKVKDAGNARFMRLGDLPDAHMEIAVNRIGVDGCPAPLIVRYNVSK
jgi:hypothetical protein